MMPNALNCNESKLTLSNVAMGRVPILRALPIAKMGTAGKTRNFSGSLNPCWRVT